MLCMEIASHVDRNESYQIHQELRDKVREREKVVILIRLQLSFGLRVALRGQAETFVFHYIAGSRI